MKVMKSTKNKNTERKKCGKEPEKNQVNNNANHNDNDNNEKKSKQTKMEKKLPKLNRVRIMNYLL